MNVRPLRQHLLITAAFAALTLSVGMAIGVANRPDIWFEGLAKPSFYPPNWLFGPVWSALYVGIGIAGGLVSIWPRAATAIALWWVQLLLNFLWSPLFFSLHRIDLALVVIALLLVVIWAFVAVTFRRVPWAALLFVPYGLWVLFATILNAGFYRLNPGN